MLKLCLYGFILYILGIIAIKIRIDRELQENPGFINEFIDKYGIGREEALGDAAPYIASIIPVINILLGGFFIAALLDDNLWAKLKEEMLDKN